MNNSQSIWPSVKDRIRDKATSQVHLNAKILDLKPIEQAYQELSRQKDCIYYSKGEALNEEELARAEKFDWMTLANDYVFNYRTDYVKEYIKKVHDAKVSSEKDFKVEIDRLIF